MKSKALILILICAVFLSACNEAGESFSLDTYGETFSTENAVFCVGSNEISAYDLKGEKYIPCLLQLSVSVKGNGRIYHQGRGTARH